MISLYILSSLVLMLVPASAFLDTTFTFHAVDSEDVIGKEKIVPIWPATMDDEDYCASKEGEIIGSVTINTKLDNGANPLFCVYTYESTDCSGVAIMAHPFNRTYDGYWGDAKDYRISESPKSAQVDNFSCGGSSDQVPPADQAWQQD